jgi:large subunit ribosomal protein L17
MRHRVAFRKLGRDSAHRKAMLRTMVTQLIKHERIRTTWAKAKETQRMAEKMVTYAKKGQSHHFRLAKAFVRDDLMVRKLFSELGERYADRSGGYTRVLRVGTRKGDAADMALLEFIDRPNELRDSSSSTLKLTLNDIES